MARRRRIVGRIVIGLVAVLALGLAGLFAWGYAPDLDPAVLQAEYAAPPSQFLTLANGQRVHVRDEGPRDAPAILLIHGSNASLHTWQGWAEALRQRYRVVRYDQPGHGLTGPQVKGDYRAEAMADTGAMVMARLGINHYAVAGNSMGGWVAWHIALAHPDRVGGLVLVDAAGAPDARPARLPIGFRLAASPLMRPLLTSFTPRSIIAKSLEQSVGNPARVSDAMVDRYWRLLRYPGNRAALAPRAAAPRDTASMHRLVAIKVPVLILWGKRDQLIPVANARWFARALPQAQTIIYPDLGHIPMEEAPARTARDLAAWLARTQTGAAATPVTRP